MPLSIFGLYRIGAVIILTAGGDCSHGGWIWSEMKRLRERADRAFTGTSLLSPFWASARCLARFGRSSPG